MSYSYETKRLVIHEEHPAIGNTPAVICDQVSTREAGELIPLIAGEIEISNSLWYVGIGDDQVEVTPCNGCKPSLPYDLPTGLLDYGPEPTYDDLKQRLQAVIDNGGKPLDPTPPRSI